MSFKISIDFKTYYCRDGEVKFGPLYSVLRHQRPFIVYQGTKTGVTLTVFGSEKLPESRRVFLQPRGYRTGLLYAITSFQLLTFPADIRRSGWNIGRLLGGSHLPGIDVTPKERIQQTDLVKKQRKQLEDDFSRLFHPAQIEEPRGAQSPLETLQVHIPVRAEDGYYRFRVTSDAAGKHEIAVSPSFRLGSVSWASASPRGATPIGLVPEVLVRTSFEVARTAGE